jgi:hypothetical protein
LAFGDSQNGDTLIFYVLMCLFFMDDFEQFDALQRLQGIRARRCGAFESRRIFERSSFSHATAQDPRKPLPKRARVAEKLADELHA